MIYIVIDRCVECGDKVNRENLIDGMCEGCRAEMIFWWNRVIKSGKTEASNNIWILKLN